ncbi:50S ribosomal protein L31 [Salinicoccus sp. HZC-1]|uniref:50S ribosomal protein L31 n=1 Tax=Salinicoccus sp. HZC-1 TaxID=3385497 RepID=UPI00398A9E3E
MKQAIHPEYNNVKVVCSCGNEFETGSVNNEDIKVEVCSECHPFYTGRQKFASADGRIEKFNKKFGFKSANEE